MNNRYPFYKKVQLFLSLFVPRRSKYGQIFFTTKCNLNCDYCQVTQRKTKDTSIEHWKKIVEKLYHLGVRYISITGGEPTVRKDLEELILCLSKMHIFSSLNSNGDLLSPLRIDSLAEAGLCSLVLSLDSLDKSEGTKSNAERVFEHLAYAGGRGIIPQVKAVVNPHDSEKVIPLAEEVVKRDFFFGAEPLQAVGGCFSRPSRFSLIVNGLAQTATGIWLPAECFQEATGISWTWKCNPTIDTWITVNNDGTLMVCQEWGSGIPILSINDLDNPQWRNYKREVVEQCPGCYYECYFSKEAVDGRPFASLKDEFGTLQNMWRMLH